MERKRKKLLFKSLSWNVPHCIFMISSYYQDVAESKFQLVNIINSRCSKLICEIVPTAYFQNFWNNFKGILIYFGVLQEFEKRSFMLMGETVDCRRQVFLVTVHSPFRYSLSVLAHAYILIYLLNVTFNLYWTVPFEESNFQKGKKKNIFL